MVNIPHRREPQPAQLNVGRPGYPPPPRGTGNPTANQFVCDEYVASKLVAGRATGDIRPPISPVSLNAGLTNRQFIIDAGGSAPEVRQWTVAMQARDLRVEGASLGDPLPERTAINGQRVGRQLQALVEWSLGSTFDNQAILDIGDNFQWSVPAKRVRVSLLFPNIDSFIVDTDPAVWEIAPTPTGYLAEISATLSGQRDNHQFSSVSSFTCTESKDVSAVADDQRFYVPPFAREVTIITEGAPGGDMIWRADEDGTVPIIGPLQFPTTTPQNIFRAPVPGHATFINAPAGYVGARLTAIWTIRPT